MTAITALVLLFTTVNIANANFKIDSLLGGREISIGPYSSRVSVGNLTQKYYKLKPADVKATQNVAELVELLRRIIGVGIFTLPPLDPFTSHHLKPVVVGPDSFVSGKVYLKSVTVTGAKHFDLKLIELRTRTGRIDFEIEFPKINFNVDFETDLYVSDLIPVSLNGVVRGQVDKLRVVGALQTEVLRGTGQGHNAVYQISGATVQIQVNDVKVVVKGMHLDDDLLESVFAGDENSHLSYWTASTGDQISEYAVITFISLANDVLHGVSVAQVNALLLPEPADDARH